MENDFGFVHIPDAPTEEQASVKKSGSKVAERSIVKKEKVSDAIISNGGTDANSLTIGQPLDANRVSGLANAISNGLPLNVPDFGVGDLLNQYGKPLAELGLLGFAAKKMLGGGNPPAPVPPTTPKPDMRNFGQQPVAPAPVAAPNEPPIPKGWEDIIAKSEANAAAKAADAAAKANPVPQGMTPGIPTSQPNVPANPAGAFSQAPNYSAAPEAAPVEAAPQPKPDLVAAAQSGEDMSKVIKEDVAHMVQEADHENVSKKQTPVLKYQSAGVNQYLNMFGFQKKAPDSPRSLAAIDAVNKLVEQQFKGVAPQGASGNPQGYRNQYIPFIENNANTLAPETQEHLNKSRTKAQIGTVEKLIAAGVPLSQQGRASLGGMAATMGAAAIPALAAAGYHAYQGNKEKVNAELKDAWNSMKSVVTMPVDVAKAAGKGDFGPFKDLLMSINPGTLLMNEANKRDESAIQRMIQAEKVGAGRGIAPFSAYQR